MRVHVVNVMRPEAGASTRDRFIAFAREVEARGFAGLWVTDAFGRGRPSLDPVGLMNIIAAVTDRVEIGTCVLQVPVRHPVELAHRIAGLHAMAGDRLKLGLGSGSTKADFDLVGADYEARFKTLMTSLDTMRRAWRGEALTPEGTTLVPWPGTAGGPALMLGAWRNKRWIVYAAEQCQGWIASGLYPKPAELEAGMKFYRDVGGRRAVLANVIVDLNGNGEGMPLGGRASVMLTGGEAAARARLQWIRDVGFDDVLCMTRPENLDDLSRLRDAL